MTNPRTNTQWHRLLGKLLEELLTPVGITVYTDFPVMSDPPAADILLLRRQGSRWTSAQRDRLPDGVRDCTARHILLEFKYTESLNEMALRQALAYDTFYKRIQKLKDVDVQTFLLSAKTPNAQFLAEFGYRRSEQPGVYYSQNQLVQLLPILSLNELRNEAHNVFVRFFASQRQQKAAAFDGVRNVDQKLLVGRLQMFLVGLRLYWFEREDEMKEKELTVDQVLAIGETWGKWFLDSLPPEKLLAGLAPEERLAGLAPEERLAGLAPEERVAGLAPQERLAGLAPEERLAGLAPEERVAGLTPEEILTLLPIDKIEAYLNRAKKRRKTNGQRKKVKSTKE
jgi:hypothetical protein